MDNLVARVYTGITEWVVGRLGTLTQPPLVDDRCQQ